MRAKKLQQITVIIDTREKDPWPFPSGFKTEQRGLATGDYSVAGFEDSIAVERKNLNDFVQSVIHDKRQFFDEIFRLSQMKHAAIVVEGNLSDIIDQTYRSEAHPSSVLGMAMYIMMTYRIPVLFASDRRCARIAATMFLQKAAETRMAENCMAEICMEADNG